MDSENGILSRFCSSTNPVLCQGRKASFSVGTDSPITRSSGQAIHGGHIATQESPWSEMGAFRSLREFPKRNDEPGVKPIAKNRSPQAACMSQTRHMGLTYMPIKPDPFGTTWPDRLYMAMCRVRAKGSKYLGVVDPHHGVCVVDEEISASQLSSTDGLLDDVAHIMNEVCTIVSPACETTQGVDPWWTM